MLDRHESSEDMRVNMRESNSETQLCTYALKTRTTPLELDVNHTLSKVPGPSHTPQTLMLPEALDHTLPELPLAPKLLSRVPCFS